LCGALVAVNRDALFQWDAKLRSLLASLGFVGCLISFYVFSFEGLHHPGLATLLPVVSTAFVLAFAGPGNVPGVVLSWRPLGGIGLISYSLYLWHQPVFALYRVHQGRALTDLELAALIVLSFALAIFSWAMIERPFRRRNVVSRQMIFRWAAVFVLLPFLAGAGLSEMKGFPHRVGDDVNEVYSQMQKEAGNRRRGIRLGTCHYNKKFGGIDEFLREWDCLPTGSSAEPAIKLLACCDSHAADKAWALRVAGAPVGNLGGAHCSLHPTGARPGCREILHRALELARSGRISGLLLAQRWDKQDFDPKELAETKAFWREAGVPIVIFTQMPEFQRIKDKIARRGMRGEPYDTIRHEEERINDGDPIIRRAFEEPPFTVIDLKGAFCDGAGNLCSAFADGRPLLIDYGHLGLLGAQHVGPRLVADPVWQEWFESLKPVK